MAPLRIFIVGGGIAGPAVAIGLARNGHDVTIYERSALTSAVGYAFRITPNSDRCLKYLGIDTVAGGAVSVETVYMLNSKGQTVYERKENEDVEKAKRGTSVFAYRPNLHGQLMTAAIESGVTVKTGVTVTSVDVSGTAIETDGGGTVSADIIIAADGVHSVIRPHVIDSARYTPRASSGHDAFRFMISKPLAQHDSVISPVLGNDARMLAWAGDDKRILVYPVDYDTQLNITCTHPERLSEKETLNEDSAIAIAYDQKASIETVLSIYGDFGPVAKRLIELADPSGFRIWKLVDMDEIPNWSRNHTVLLGDACHPILPFGFSGASMAIEDALTLSTLLTAGLHREEIPGRLKLYADIRKPRVARVRESSREIARGSDDKNFISEYRQFLDSHDAVEHAQQALSKYLKEQGTA